MFRKVVESFRCEHCGAFVRGTGFTNHCPQCLWSKHVDVDPGDRAATCGGLMEPVEYRYAESEKWIMHACGICGARKKNKIQRGDSIAVLLRL